MYELNKMTGNDDPSEVGEVVSRGEEKRREKEDKD